MNSFKNQPFRAYEAQPASGHGKGVLFFMPGGDKMTYLSTCVIAWRPKDVFLWLPIYLMVIRLIRLMKRKNFGHKLIAVKPKKKFEQQLIIFKLTLLSKAQIWEQ
jgi:hypothetical protein